MGTWYAIKDICEVSQMGSIFIYSVLIPYKDSVKEEQVEIEDTFLSPVWNLG